MSKDYTSYKRHRTFCFSWRFEPGVVARQIDSDNPNQLNQFDSRWTCENMDLISMYAGGWRM